MVLVGGGGSVVLVALVVMVHGFVSLHGGEVLVALVVLAVLAVGGVAAWLHKHISLSLIHI
eukprot:9709050-Prorocentrum_lima.AAC.1